MTSHVCHFISDHKAGPIKGGGSEWKCAIMPLAGCSGQEKN